MKSLSQLLFLLIYILQYAQTHRISIKYHQFQQNQVPISTSLNIYQSSHSLIQQLPNPNYIAQISLYQQPLRIRSSNQYKKIQQQPINENNIPISKEKNHFNQKYLNINSNNGWDWRKSKQYRVIGSIKKQGTCGICWAIVVVQLFQSILAIKTKENSKNLSEQYVLQCVSPTSNCGGGDIYAALQFVIKNGIPSNQQYPYLAAQFPSSNIKPQTMNICNGKNNIKLPDKFILNTFFNVTDDLLKKKIHQSPIAALFYVQREFIKYNKSQGKYICKQHYEQYEMNHAVLVIGYDQQGNYIIKNSWGQQWGQGGYGIIDKKYDCGIKQRIYTLKQELFDGSGKQYILNLILILLLCLTL